VPPTVVTQGLACGQGAADEGWLPYSGLLAGKHPPDPPLRLRHRLTPRSAEERAASARVCESQSQSQSEVVGVGELHSNTHRDPAQRQVFETVLKDLILAAPIV
jgi:hypothetical protein